MNSISTTTNSNTIDNNDTTQQQPHVQDVGRRSETTITTGTDTPTTSVVVAVTPSTVVVPVVVSMEVAVPRSTMATTTTTTTTGTTATTTMSESYDNIKNAYNRNVGNSCYPKTAGHHFYYLPPPVSTGIALEHHHDDFGRKTDQLPTSRTSSTDSNEQQQQYLSLPLPQKQSNTTFILQHHQHQPLTTVTFPSSPMVTPPVHKGYVNATDFREPSSTTTTTTTSNNITASTTQKKQYSMFHHPMTQQQRQQQPQQQQQPLFHHHQVAVGVPHVYRDYISPGAWNNDIGDDEMASTFIRKKTGGVSQPFPEKLHEMLTTVENTVENDIVTWLPHGRAFIVRKPKEFTDFIMPKYVCFITLPFSCIVVPAFQHVFNTLYNL